MKRNCVKNFQNKTKITYRCEIIRLKSRPLEGLIAVHTLRRKNRHMDSSHSITLTQNSTDNDYIHLYKKQINFIDTPRFA